MNPKLNIYVLYVLSVMLLNIYTKKNKIISNNFVVLKK